MRPKAAKQCSCGCSAVYAIYYRDGDYYMNHGHWKKRRKADLQKKLMEVQAKEEEAERGTQQNAQRQN